MDPGGEVRQLHGLGDEVVRPRLQHLLGDLQSLLHRQASSTTVLESFPSPAQELHPAHLGHVVVHQHQVQGPFGHPAQGDLRIAGDAHGPALAAPHGLQGVEDAPIVVQHPDGKLRHALSPSALPEGEGSGSLPSRSPPDGPRGSPVFPRHVHHERQAQPRGAPEGFPRRGSSRKPGPLSRTRKVSAPPSRKTRRGRPLRGCLHRPGGVVQQVHQGRRTAPGSGPGGPPGPPAVPPPAPEATRAGG
jgi:hypothetical protein